MYTPKKIHAGFVGTLLLLSALLMLFFHTRPAKNERSELKTSIANLNQEILSLQGLQTGTSTLTELSEVDQRELSQKIPETLEQDFIITELDRIAKATEVSFNALSFSLRANSELPSVNISAGFQGTLGNVTRFLKMLEVDTRKFVVKDAGVSAAESESGLNLVNLNVNIEAYYRQDE